MESTKLAAQTDAGASHVSESTPATGHLPLVTTDSMLSTLKDACANITGTVPADEREIWHLIDAVWFKQLKKFADSKVEDKCSGPDKLDNRSLLENNDAELIGEFQPVKNTARDEEDYVLAPDNEWKVLLSLGLVDAAEDIHRLSFTMGNEALVEVQPLDFIVRQHDGDKKNDKRLLISRSATCNDLYKNFRSKRAEIRIWRKPHMERMELLCGKEHNLKLQLKNIDFCDKELLVIETKKSSHDAWPLDLSKARLELFPDVELADDSRQNNYAVMPNSAAAATESRYNLRSKVKRLVEDIEIVVKEGKPEVISRQPDGVGRCGLINLGNTCFMNSTLQCLIHLPDLRDYFLNTLHLFEINTRNPLGHGGRMATAFGNVMRSVWENGAVTFSPRKFKHILGQAYPQFYGFWEQDSQEFMTYLLDGVHEDLNRIQAKPYVKYGDADGRSDQDLAQESWNNFRLRNQSVIVDLFFGLIKSTVTCPDCNRVSVTFDPVNQLSCPLPGELQCGNSAEFSSQAKNAGVELDDCLRAIIQPERLSEHEMWFCKTCQDYKQAEKKLELWSLPPYLILHLKRFRYNRSQREKLRQHVRIPEELDMSQYIICAEHRRPIMYDFIAVSNHTGDLGEGHYWAHAKDRDGRWMQMSDDIVKSSSYAEAAGQEDDESAYLVFFKLRDFWYDLEQLPIKVSSQANNLNGVK